MNTDTIAAIATAMANSGIGIIRMSGNAAIEIADKVFRSKSNQSLKDCKSHTIHYGYIMNEDEVVDEVLVMIMKAPNSYTRENTIEINCHGGVLVMQKILETVMKYGARPAEPGEFTKRAFLNGRIDLAQAESVIDIINSKNDFALKSSISQLKGKISDKIANLRKIIIHETAYIESAVDDPEHYTLDGYAEHLSEVILNLQNELQRLLDTADQGRILKEGIHTVIVGKPNVGKSSVLNVLVGSERAIVTDVAGTTRDILEEQVNLNGIMLNVIDTAGIHETEDIVEKIGVDKAKQYLENADLVLYVLDSSQAMSEEDHKIAEMVRGKNVIILLNKSDLEQKAEREEFDQLSQLSDHIVLISAKEGNGIDDLTKIIYNMFLNGNITFNDELVITNIRHKNALSETMESLHYVEESIQNQMPEDFYSIDLMHAYETLGTIIGESVEDDLADEIFAKFCMGK